jgi:threonine dehydrogenase-like Zn-dependent dehydrogenase
MKALLWHGRRDVRVETVTDPLGTEDLATHRLPLEDAQRGYELFERKEDGAVKVVLEP